MARDEYGFNKVWTSDSRIMVIEEGSAKPRVVYGSLKSNEMSKKGKIF